MVTREALDLGRIDIVEALDRGQADRSGGAEEELAGDAATLPIVAEAALAEPGCGRELHQPLDVALLVEFDFIDDHQVAPADEVEVAPVAAQVGYFVTIGLGRVEADEDRTVVLLTGLEHLAHGLDLARLVGARILAAAVDENRVLASSDDATGGACWC